ncbi:hypothetical protein BGZ46_001176, partial [Entomortierella lignicola]
MRANESNQGWMTQSSRKFPRKREYNGLALHILISSEREHGTPRVFYSNPPPTSDYGVVMIKPNRRVQPRSSDYGVMNLEPDSSAVLKTALNESIKINHNEEQLPSPYYAPNQDRTPTEQHSTQLHFENKRRGNSHGQHAIAAPVHRDTMIKHHLHLHSEPWDHHNHHRHQCHGECCDIASSKENSHGINVIKSHMPKRSIGHRGHRPAHSIQPVMDPEYDIDSREQAGEPHIANQGTGSTQAHSLSPELNIRALFPEVQDEHSYQDPTVA